MPLAVKRHYTKDGIADTALMSNMNTLVISLNVFLISHDKVTLRLTKCPSHLLLCLIH